MRATGTGFRAMLLGVVLAAGCAPAASPARAPYPVSGSPPLTTVTSPERPAPADRLLESAPTAVGFGSDLRERLDSIISAAVSGGAAPGAAVAVGRHGRLVMVSGYGRTAASLDGIPVTDSTLYDLASLTKVVATTTAAMMLEEQGVLHLDRTLGSYLPELRDPAKAGITVRMLLTHSGGLEAFAPLFQTIRGPEAYLRAIDERPLQYAPGTRMVYSDWDMILLQFVIERITGQNLDHYLDQRLFAPLGMRDTRFRPGPALHRRTAPTELDGQRGLIHGEVHDPNAWALGGIAGHAGLFSSVRDLSVFAQMLLNGGSYDGVKIRSPATIARWTAPQGPGSSRALGWDTPSGQSSSGRYFSPRSFGHTGFTGTSMWIDPERSLFVVLLTNRVHYTANNQLHVPLRRAVADAVQAAIVDAPLVDWESGR
jgi:CubicO group peptidase (beta-lactamase class C family)